MNLCNNILGVGNISLMLQVGGPHRFKIKEGCMIFINYGYDNKWLIASYNHTRLNYLKNDFAGLPISFTVENNILTISSSASYN